MSTRTSPSKPNLTDKELKDAVHGSKTVQRTGETDRMFPIRKENDGIRGFAAEDSRHQGKRRAPVGRRARRQDQVKAQSSREEGAKLSKNMANPPASITRFDELRGNVVRLECSHKLPE
ncbi:unnamed protein product [Phytophthora fragariaefolia]|uniref:Unnamed protein product n=1 Tax=Phytophthora fragariaefolia TaxID=1490495 RepID=A0A9W6WY40_9STRA|nr:unnamed protein product [Phytophthora fragariaefolia]